MDIGRLFKLGSRLKPRTFICGSPKLNFEAGGKRKGKRQMADQKPPRKWLVGKWHKKRIRCQRLACVRETKAVGGGRGRTINGQKPKARKMRWQK